MPETFSFKEEPYEPDPVNTGVGTGGKPSYALLLARLCYPLSFL